MKRSARDYLVYMLTMILVTALMYAFSSLLFQNELERQFTMGTLTSLFTLALLGASFALMFSGYENTVLDGKFPFDCRSTAKKLRMILQKKKG